jgi:hypothetical protein
MNGTAPQSCGKTAVAVNRRSDYDLANGAVVRQHADDDLAIEQIAEIHRGLETERDELFHLVRPTDVGDYPTSGGGEIAGHRRPHVAEADKSDFGLRRQAAACSGAAASVEGCGLGRSCCGKKRRIGLFLEHGHLLIKPLTHGLRVRMQKPDLRHHRRCVNAL